MGKIIRSQLYLRKHLVTSSSSCKDTITNSDFRNSLHITRFQRHDFITCKARRGRNSRTWTRSYLWFRCNNYWGHICHDLLPKAVVLTCTTGTRSECENSRKWTRTVCSRISRCSDGSPCQIKMKGGAVRGKNVNCIIILNITVLVIISYNIVCLFIVAT